MANLITSGVPSTNFDKLKSNRKLIRLSNIVANIGTFGQKISDEALKKKIAEAEDPRLNDEYTDMMSLLNDSKYSRLTENQLKNLYQAFNFRNFLRQKAEEPELEEIIETLCNEVIVNDASSKFFAKPFLNKTDLPPNVRPEIIEQIEKNLSLIWSSIYRMAGMSGTGAWDVFKEFLIEGPLAYEIVYDNIKNPKRIIGMIKLDALTLTEEFLNNERWWVQDPKYSANGQKKILHDSQVIFIKWSENGKISYLHRLIRPFNISRLMERTKINWFVLNSMFRTTNIIPVSGKGRAKAAKTLSSAMNRYRDQVDFDDNLGMMYVNGSPNIPASKEYWLADTDSGTPEISTIGSDGPDLSSLDNLDYFQKRLYKISKQPIDRFDPSSSETWNMDPTSQKRQEINYSNFTDRIRDKYSQIVLKPLLIQLCLMMPDIINDYELLDAIKLQYQKYNIFDELAEMEVFEKKAQFCETLISSFEDQDSDGNSISWFPKEWVIERFMGFSAADLESLKAARKKEMNEKLKFNKAAARQNKKLEDYKAKLDGDNDEETNSASSADGEETDTSGSDNQGSDQEGSGGTEETQDGAEENEGGSDQEGNEEVEETQEDEEKDLQI